MTKQTKQSELRAILDDQGLAYATFGRLAGIPKGQIDGWIHEGVVPHQEDVKILAKLLAVEPWAGRTTGKRSRHLQWKVAEVKAKRKLIQEYLEASQAFDLVSIEYAALEERSQQLREQQAKVLRAAEG